VCSNSSATYSPASGSSQARLARYIFHRIEPTNNCFNCKKKKKIICASCIIANWVFPESHYGRNERFKLLVTRTTSRPPLRSNGEPKICVSPEGLPRSKANWTCTRRESNGLQWIRDKHDTRREASADHTVLRCVGYAEECSRSTLEKKGAQGRSTFSEGLPHPFYIHRLGSSSMLEIERPNNISG